MRFSSSKEFACQCRTHGFDSWVGKIPWKRKWKLIPIFLAGKSHQQRSQADNSPWVTKSWTWLSDWKTTSWDSSMCQSLTGSYVQGPWCQGIYGVIWELKTEFGVNPELFPFTYSDWQSEIYIILLNLKWPRAELRGIHIYYIYIYVIIDIQHIAQLA